MTASAPTPRTPSNDPLTYDEAGVRYDLIDPWKVQAQRAAAATAPLLARHGMQEIAASRGESAYVFDAGPFHIASIVECLGSKALVADAMAERTGRSYYDAIAQDTLAMAINDLITVGATPLAVQAYWAAGGSEWFANAARAQALVDGWRRACESAGVAWGGGETPALAGIVENDRIDLAAGCVGIVQPKSRLTLGERLAAGDAIVLLDASGIHANGLSLARAVADRLPQGYATDIGDGRSFGEALLVPTPLYSRVTEGAAAAGIDVHYAANITGHGWRKLLRHPGAFDYRIHTLPPVPRVLAFLAEQAGHDAREAYATFNMGAGFALFVAPADAERCVGVAQAAGIGARVAGRVEAGTRRLHIEPLGIVFEGDALQLR